MGTDEQVAKSVLVLEDMKLEEKGHSYVTGK